MCLFQGHGFWFIYPNEPIDASEGSGMMALNEAKHTAIFEFNNNVAHSNKKVSININCTSSPWHLIRDSSGSYPRFYDLTLAATIKL